MKAPSVPSFVENRKTEKLRHWFDPKSSAANAVQNSNISSWKQGRFQPLIYLTWWFSFVGKKKHPFKHVSENVGNSQCIVMVNVCETAGWVLVLSFSMFFLDLRYGELAQNSGSILGIHDKMFQHFLCLQGLQIWSCSIYILFFIINFPYQTSSHTRPGITHHAARNCR